MVRDTRARPRIGSSGITPSSTSRVDGTIWCGGFFHPSFLDLGEGIPSMGVERLAFL